MLVDRNQWVGPLVYSMHDPLASLKTTTLFARLAARERQEEVTPENEAERRAVFLTASLVARRKPSSTR